jgi:Arrestin (or S-antigen), N-terminal domain/Arrestin (or S-antigen), C-terminal domain
LEICGWAEASWKKTEEVVTENGKQSKEVTYTGKEEYVSSKIRLLTASTGKEVEIPKGTNVYNFQCFIPAVAPTSFEGTLGFIRYTVSLKLERPMKDAESFLRAFTVIRSVDLNNESPTLRLPCQMERIKTFCCWPCSSDPLIMTVQIPMAGYVAGQQIQIDIEVNNQSRIDIEDMKVELRKNIVYSVHDPKESSKSEVVWVTDAKLPGVKAHSTFKEQRKIEIPSISPTDTTQSSIIHQSYELLVTGTVEGCYGNPKILIPITIGTVPLIQAYTSASALSENEIVGPQVPLLEGYNAEELREFGLGLYFIYSETKFFASFFCSTTILRKMRRRWRKHCC